MLIAIPFIDGEKASFLVEFGHQDTNKIQNSINLGFLSHPYLYLLFAIPEVDAYLFNWAIIAQANSRIALQNSVLEMLALGIDLHARDGYHFVHHFD